MKFQDEYAEIYNMVKNDIEKVSNNVIKEINIEEPFKSKLINILTAPSKHIRTLISFLYLKMFGREIDEKQIIFHSAIELAHNASLIHDDIMDESLIRRNTDTLNSSFGDKTAVICGDYILSIAMQQICKLNSIQLVEIFSQTLSEMTQGEMFQINSKYKIPKIDEYIKKNYQKTAKLFETALEGSLILANINTNAKEFAKNFGIAFQIRDDLINTLTTKSDLSDGIYTAPIIFSQDITTPENGIEKTRILLNNYLSNAEKSLQFSDNNEYKQALIKLLGIIGHA